MRRERHAAPLQERVRSAELLQNLQLPMALSERRYRRNWLVRFCRQPVRIASACRIPIADTAACAATHEKQIKFRKIPLFFIMACYNESAE